MSAEQLVVVSNRGPVTFDRDDDGNLSPRRGGGGLASALRPLLLAGAGVTWVAAALNDADREVAAAGLHESDGLRLRLLAIDPSAYRMAYDVISNATLWYLHHGLYDRPRRPRFDRRWHEAWAAYREVNNEFAEAVAKEADESATVLVQDYHLALLGARLAGLRPDLRLVHFTHTPFADPESYRMLPDYAGRELLEGMAAYHACGFHTERWAACFTACARQTLGYAPPTFAAPLAPDVDDLLAVAQSPDCEGHFSELDASLAGRQAIVRIDRIELSKNLLRGFYAFHELLDARPDLREQVVFVCFAYPSREGLADYLAYRHEVEALVRLINERWGTPTWTPIVLNLDDNFAQSVAALRRADVVVVNPLRDGLNLVAKEAAIVNQRQASLVLSHESGVWAELGPAAFGVNPFDVTATGEAMGAALDLSDEARATRFDKLRRLATMTTVDHWLSAQRAAASHPPHGT